MKNFRITFLCFTIYQLNVAFYYAIKLKNTKCEYTLIWNNFINQNIDINLYKKPFDNIILINNYESGSIILRQINKCVAAGKLFFLSKLGTYYKNPRNKEILICFSDQHTLTHKMMEEVAKVDSHEIILVEEGMNTYMDSTHIGIRNKLVNLVLGLKTEEYIGKSNLIDTMIVKQPEMLLPKKRKHRKVIKQNNIFIEEGWQKDIIRVIKKYLLQYTNSNLMKSSILWLGQPLEIDNGINIDTQKRILDSLINMIPNHYSVYIKLHPRENISKYAFLKKYDNVEIINLGNYSWIPVEILAKTLNPDVIMSTYSSAVQNIKQIIPKSKAIFVFPLFRLKIDKRIFKKLCTNENYYIANSVEDINKILYYRTIKSPEIINNRVNNDEDIVYIKNSINSKKFKINERKSV